jgi:hypothetical protein
LFPLAPRFRLILLGPLPWFLGLIGQRLAAGWSEQTGRAGVGELVERDLRLAGRLGVHARKFRDREWPFLERIGSEVKELAVAIAFV